MLKINHLNVSYQEGKPVVQEVSFSMKKKEILCIVGESGSGKTSVLKSIMDAHSKNSVSISGEILFQGKQMNQLSKEEKREIYGSKMAMIGQDTGEALNPIRRIGSQYIEYIQAHEKIPKEQAKKRALHMLYKMQLEDGERIMRSYPFQLSGGMRQRVGIAMAMTFHPDLLLADEPTSALDVLTQNAIVQEMASLREQYDTGILLVTHNLSLAAYLADQLIVMEKGRIVDAGKTEEVLHHPSSAYTRNLLKAVPTMEDKRLV